MATKVIGKLVPDRQVSLPSKFDDFMLGSDSFNERLGLIPAEIAPSRVQRILTGAADGHLGELYEMYRKMEATDARFGGYTSQFLSAIAGVPLKVEAREGNTAAENALAGDYAAVVEEQLALIDTHSLVQEFARAWINGVRVFEYRYELKDFAYNKRLAFIDKVRSISGAALSMDTESDSPTRGELLVKLKEGKEPVPLSRFHEDKVSILQTEQGGGFYDTLGAARSCVSWWITKIYAQLWWTEFVEVYGQPIRIARYPQGAGTRTKNTMERFLKTLGKSAYGLFPQGVEVQLLEANKSGSVTTYDDLIERCNAEMAIRLMGQVETTGEQKYGSRAKAQVLNGVRYDILRDVAAMVRKGFDLMIRALLRTNYGTINERLLPKVVPVLPNPTDIQTLTSAYSTLSNAGVPLDLESVYESLGIAKPKPGATVLIKGNAYVVPEDGKLDTLFEQIRKDAQKMEKERAEQKESESTTTE